MGGEARMKSLLSVSFIILSSSSTSYTSELFSERNDDCTASSPFLIKNDSPNTKQPYLTLDVKKNSLSGGKLSKGKQKKRKTGKQENRKTGKQGNRETGKQHGSKEAWKHGSMEAWKHGRMEEWKNGSMEAWMQGSMEAWKHGSMKAWKHGSR